MQPLSVMKWHKKFSAYHIGVILSGASMGFGLLREFIVIGLLGFSAQNDLLQIYISIFYTIGLMIDAMRLSCLNLFSVLTLKEIIFSASIVAIPFVLVISGIMSYLTGGLDLLLLVITIVGSYLNLIAALLVTYKQRNNVFLSAQIINVLPNFILIPGVILAYFFLNKHIVGSIIVLTSLIPVVQCILLLCLPEMPHEKINSSSAHFFKSTMTFLRHFASMLGEQFFQIITRSAFFQFGTGYLSLFSLCMRIYAALRFILIDSYIGSKLFAWDDEAKNENVLFVKIIQSTFLSCLVALGAFLLSVKKANNLYYVYIQLSGLLLLGFYFSTLVRVMYFKINRYINSTPLVLQFASYELLFAGIAFLLTKYFHDAIFLLLWLGFIAKPLAQLFFLRKKFVAIQLAT